MSKIILLLVALCLLGCTPATKLNNAKGEFLCKEHGGMYALRNFNQHPIMCVDGTKFDVGIVNSTIITDPKFYPE